MTAARAPYTVPVKTLLILAGKSRRFWPLMEKPLFPVCGKTLVEHQVDRLRAAGCDDIILVASKNNMAEIGALFPDLPLVEQKKLELGMLGAFLEALPLCGTEPVLLVSGNDFIDPSAFADLRAEASAPGVAGALLASKVKRYFPGGYLTVQEDRIFSILEKPGEGNEPSDLVNIVAHIHNDASVLRAALETEAHASDDGYERVLDRLFKQGDYRAVPYSGPWQAVKYPWHLLHLLPALLGEIKGKTVHPTAQIHPTAVVEGDVIIEEGVRILPHASVIGPCFIGAGSIIGNNALVRGSSIGRKSVIGYNTEVKGSVLAGPVWTHMTYLGDSVVGENVSFGGGTITGNLRLDEGEILSAAGAPGDAASPAAPLQTGLTKMGAVIGNDCRFGIHVGTNPGIRIGAGTFVSGGVFLSEDVPDVSFVRMKDGHVDIRGNKAQTPSMAERAKYQN